MTRHDGEKKVDRMAMEREREREREKITSSNDGEEKKTRNRAKERGKRRRKNSAPQLSVQRASKGKCSRVSLIGEVVEGKECGSGGRRRTKCGTIWESRSRRDKRERERKDGILRELH